MEITRKDIWTIKCMLMGFVTISKALGHLFRHVGRAVWETDRNRDTSLDCLILLQQALSAVFASVLLSDAVHWTRD